jgi:hypothetical protein
MIKPGPGLIVVQLVFLVYTFYWVTMLAGFFGTDPQGKRLQWEHLKGNWLAGRKYVE